MTLEITKPTDSLLLGDGRQLKLLEIDELGLPGAAYDRLEERGHFTAERIFSQRPDVYRVIVKALGKEMGYREIADLCAVSVNTVGAVARREKIPIESIRQQLARLGFDGVRLTIETILEILGDPDLRRKISAKDLAIMNGILTANAQLLSGGMTANIGTGENVKAGHDDYLKFIKDVTGTGLAGGKPGQKGPTVDGVIELPATQPTAPDSAPNAGPAQS